MLAQNFMTAIELDIHDDEYLAAIRVLRMLERRELVQLPDCVGDPNIRGFNMAGWIGLNERDECGTVGCIGGWMQVLAGHSLSWKCIENFGDLFFPKNYMRTPEFYSVEKAAIAMRSKLTTGKANWES